MPDSKRFLLTAGLAALFTLMSPVLPADPPADKGKPVRAHQKGHDEGHEIRDAVVLATALLTRDEARTIIQEHGGGGCKPIPPGIQKNLARGKPMPPGIQKTRLPDPILNALPAHAGHEWSKVGCDLVLQRRADRVIAEILLDVFL